MGTSLEVTNTWNHWHQMFQASYEQVTWRRKVWDGIASTVYVLFCLLLASNIDVLWLRALLVVMVVGRFFRGQTMAMLCYLGSRWLSRRRVIWQIEFDERGLRIRQNRHEKEIPWSECREFSEREDSFLIEVRNALKTRHSQRVLFVIPKDSFQDEVQLSQFRSLALSLIDNSGDE